MRRLFFLLLLLSNSFLIAQKKDSLAYGIVDSNGLKQGYWVTYVENLKWKIVTQHFVNDTLNGITRIKDLNIVEELNYNKGQLDGVSRRFHKGVLIKEIYYDNGHINRVVTYNFKGVLESNVEYKDGLEHGVSIYYLKGNILDQQEFKHGQANGNFIFYYTKTGTPSVIGQYKEGKKYGIWIGFDKKGNIKNITDLGG